MQLNMRDCQPGCAQSRLGGVWCCLVVAAAGVASYGVVQFVVVAAAAFGVVGFVGGGILDRGGCGGILECVVVVVVVEGVGVVVGVVAVAVVVGVPGCCILVMGHVSERIIKQKDNFLLLEVNF